MDFLTRFQGRTNFVTKEGITSVMTDSSCPIDKLTPQPLVETPRPISTKNLHFAWYINNE